MASAVRLDLNAAFADRLRACSFEECINENQLNFSLLVLIRISDNVKILHL